MRRISLILISIVLGGLLCVQVVAQDLLKATEDKAARLSRVSGIDVGNWRYKIGDVPNGQDPALDDSSWQFNAQSSFTWGSQPLCWLRTRIVIPEKVDGVSVAGSRVTLKVGADDDGWLYVNGKEIGPFHWTHGKTVLTDNAKPGDVFSVAIKNTNSIGEGRLISAQVEYSALAPINDAIAAYMAQYNNARDLLYIANDSQRTKYLPFVIKSMNEVDLDAFSSGKTDEFLASLKTASSDIKPVSELSRGINIFLVGHAHIDMNWLWLWPETLSVCKNTFTTMGKLMNEYPGFIFSQSQPAAYAAMQEHNPEVFAMIKDRIKRGQWDASTATTWVEGDTNMASGEAIVRSILYGKRFIKQQFGVDSDVCWEPDTFGHAQMMPQILAKSGIKYYYFTRCGIGSPVFWWRSPDGSKVLAFDYGAYSKNIKPETAFEAAHFVKETGLKDYMHVYGVGDHGGGPTRDMLNREKKSSAQPDYPHLQFSTARGYFEDIAKSGKPFRVWDGDLNTIFEGCYTSHSDIKRWNRECENLIPCAETFNSIAARFGLPYAGASFEKSWRDTCFNQFHDILCGTAIHGSYDYAKQLHDEAITQAKGALDKSLDTLISRINTNGSGVPVVVFNPLSWSRTDPVSVTSPFPKEIAGVRVVDSSGVVCPAQIMDGKLCFTAHNVPALGYKVFWAAKSSQAAKGTIKSDGMVIENQYLRVRVDPARGVISEIYDKVSPRAVVPNGSSMATLQILHENRRGMSAWKIGEILDRENLTQNAHVSVSNVGPAKATITIEHDYDKSHIKQELSLYDGVPRIDIHTNVDWKKPSPGNNQCPMLKEAFATGMKSGKATFEVPFGGIERLTNGSEVPGQKWIDLSLPNYGVSLLNDCKYGFSVKDGVMHVTLIRSTHNPDPTPEEGPHEWTLSIYPHKGDWRAAGTVRKGYELNEPLIARVAAPHPGSLSSAQSFLSISKPNIIATAFKKAEDDNSYILRFYETNGSPCKAVISTRLPVKYFMETDLLERPVGRKMPISGGKFTVAVGKNEIKTYKLIP